MNRKLNITLTDATGKQFKFDTLGQISDFCVKEHNFWVKAQKSVGDKIIVTQAYTKSNNWQAIRTTLKSWEEIEPDWDEGTFNSNFQQLNQQQFRHINGAWVWHGHPFVQVWIELHSKAQVIADSFLLTILRRQPNTISTSVDHMIGHILGYEFLMQDESQITKRRNSEKRSLSQLRSELTEKNNELVSEVDTVKDDFTKWNSLKREEIKRLYKVIQRLAERQRRNQVREFSNELSEWRENIANLEKTYQELLRLKKPAEYWNASAKKYLRQGLGFSALIIIIVFVGLMYLESFFITWLQGQEFGVKLSSIQGVVIFGSIGAIYGFIVRVFSRLAFSSFHLMRDSEEREQLTYLYLSLSEETSVDENARNIVLQALFSRAETGLLAKEHGPTFPGAGEAVRYATKSKTS